jgi:activating signal cointegrator 1
MKALTLWQPWASLIALGQKTIETRCWQTPYRGPLAIHAAANLQPKWLGASRHLPEFRDALAEVFHARRDRDDRAGFHVDDAVRGLPYGRVLCVVRLVSIEPTDSMFSEHLPTFEKLFGNYDAGRYAWNLEMVNRLEDPIAAKGARRLWNWENPTICLGRQNS